MRVAIGFLLLMGLCSGTARGQTTFQEQANRLQNINAFLLDFRPLLAPTNQKRPELFVILEANPQPSVDARVGGKDEPLDPPSVVPKLRLRYATSSGLYLGGAYAPGIEFEDYKADFYSLELGYRLTLDKFSLGLRLSTSDGDVEGPITESSAEDLFDFTNQTGEFNLGYQHRKLFFYGFAGGISVDTELEIEEDGVLLKNDEDTYYGGLGIRYALGHKLAVIVEQNFTDDYLKHLSFGLSYRYK